MYRRAKVQIYLLIYIDDIIVSSSTNAAVEALLNDPRSKFALKNLDPLNYFLGIEVKPSSDGIVLTQEKYIRDILRRVGMQDCKTMRTPLPADEKLSLSDGDLLTSDDATNYRSVVGRAPIPHPYLAGYLFFYQQSLSVPACPDYSSLIGCEMYLTLSTWYVRLGYSHQMKLLVAP
jgi:hypothetical protein